MSGLARRVLGLVLWITAIAAVVFLVIHALPGDPARLMAGPQATDATVAAMRARLGLDRPLADQLGHFLVHAARGDFGASLAGGGSVGGQIARHLPWTLTLGLSAYALAVTVGVPAGIWAAARADGWPDHLLMGCSLLAAALPGFWVALLGMELFAVRLRWLPLMGAGGLSHLVMPAVTLALGPGALVMRMTRAGMRDVLARDYIRAARARGVAPLALLLRHALPNAAGPLLTVICLNLGALVSGAVVVEAVFDWPGIGRLLVDAVRYRDYPMIQAITLLAIAAVLAANLAGDVLARYFDPARSAR